MSEGYAVDLVTPDLVQPADVTLAKSISSMLQLHYPNHPWGVSVDHKNGVATIRNWGLGRNWGFLIKLADLKSDPRMKEVVNAGGELLERFRIKRFRARVEDYQQHPFLMRPDR